MLLDFFYALRQAKLPVSVTEYLTLMGALQRGVIGPLLQPESDEVSDEAMAMASKIFTF